MIVFWEEIDAQCSESDVPQDGLTSVARGVTDGFMELCKIKILNPVGWISGPSLYMMILGLSRL